MTVAHIQDGIKKLRQHSPFCRTGQQTETLYRGYANMGLDSSLGKRGGTEYGVMSVTKDIATATQFALSRGCIVMKIKVSDALSYGADITWLSCYPEQREVVYPPLTFLKPTTGIIKMYDVGDASFAVMEIEPRIP